METKVISTIKGHARVDVADVLRGLAVMGIIILHSIEHFNFYSFQIQPRRVTGSTLRTKQSGMDYSSCSAERHMPYLPFSSALVFLFRTIISACAATISDYVSAGGSSCYS